MSKNMDYMFSTLQLVFLFVTCLCFEAEIVSIDGRDYYFFHNYKTTWDNAVSVCMERDLQIVNINHGVLNDLIKYRTQEQSYWIGLTSFSRWKNEEITHVHKDLGWFSTESPLEFTNWCEKEPNSNIDTLAGYISDNKCWALANPFIDFAFICENATVRAANVIAFLGHHYFFYQVTEINFFDAYKICKSNDQDMLSIEKESVSELINKEVTRRKRHFWIGAMNFVVHGGFTTKWHWNSTSRALIFQNWCSSEVNANGLNSEHCAYINKANRCWNIAECQNTVDHLDGVICQDRKPIRVKYTTVTFADVNYYFYNNILLSWLDAYKLCEENDQRLVTIDDEEVSSFLKSKTGNQNFWIGLEAQVENKGREFYMYWRWVNTGYDTTRENWCPDNHTPDKHFRCTYLSSDGCWKFSDCAKDESISGFICENRLQHADKFDIIKYKDFEYFIYTKKVVNWYKANETCQTNYKRLISMDSRHKMDFFNRLIWGKNIAFWIGAETYAESVQSVKHVSWRWTGTNADLTFESWCDEKRRDEVLKCAYITTGELCWQKTRCSNQDKIGGFICEDVSVPRNIRDDEY